MLSKTSEHGENILNVILILSIITIFIGGITKNPLTTPTSFLFFNDCIFVKNYNFYFNFFEDFLNFFKFTHSYSFNYLKIILLATPFFGISISILIYWHTNLFNNFD